MKTHPIINDLISAEVLIERPNDDIEVAPQWREEIKGFTGDKKDARDILEQYGTVDEQVRLFIDNYVDTYDVEIACLLTIVQTFPDLTFDEKVLYSLTLSKIIDPPSRFEGTPSRFWAIDGSKLPLYQQIFDKSVAYVWRDDCPPCDHLKATFDDIPDDVYDGVTLLSIYGPDNKTELYENYSVAIAPTTLFLTSTRVDSRIVGPCMRPKLEIELEKLQNSV